MARYSSTLNKMARGETLSPVASVARTTSSSSGWLSSDEFGTASLTLAVTAATGTVPTLDVVVETRSAAGETERSVGSFAQKTAVASERKTFAGFDDEYRVRWTVAGTTPSLTFSVTGVGK